MSYLKFKWYIGLVMALCLKVAFHPLLRDIQRLAACLSSTGTNWANIFLCVSTCELLQFEREDFGPSHTILAVKDKNLIDKLVRLQTISRTTMKAN